MPNAHGSRLITCSHEELLGHIRLFSHYVASQTYNAYAVVDSTQFAYYNQLDHCYPHSSKFRLFKPGHAASRITSHITCAKYKLANDGHAGLPWLRDSEPVPNTHTQ